METQIYESHQAYKKKRDHETFKRWLNETVDNFTINEILTHLCRDVIKVTTDKGFTIINEKQLKNEIATFIYKEASIYA
jgi:hypothetical protein